MSGIYAASGALGGHGLSRPLLVQAQAWVWSHRLMFFTERMTRENASFLNTLELLVACSTIDHSILSNSEHHVLMVPFLCGLLIPEGDGGGL